MKNILYAGVFCAAMLTILSCSKINQPETTSAVLELPETPYNYFFSDDEEAALGRVLFYDRSLSANNSVSCGTCHKQQLAFADNVAFSPGFENKPALRNTPPIQNLALEGSQFLFWDGRDQSLQHMVVQPIFNHVEMGIGNPEQLVNRVKQTAYYPDLFQAAYGSTEINMGRISSALTAFIVNLQTGKQNITTDELTQRTAEQSKGFELFTGKYNCTSCHNISDPSRGYNGGSEPVAAFKNIGLDREYRDAGRGAITGDPADNGKFRVPNLRNVALTAPYMHDGRFRTLEEVIDHYSTNVQPGTNLSPELQEGSAPVRFNIPAEDKRLLIAFMNSLTDHQLISDKRLSDPFKRK